MYAQQQPPTAIANPTTIQFNKNPLLIFNGKAKELGELHKVIIAAIGVEAWQYSEQVDFVQEVKLKADVKTAINGNIAFHSKSIQIVKCMYSSTTYGTPQRVDNVHTEEVESETRQRRSSQNWAFLLRQASICSLIRSWRKRAFRLSQQSTKEDQGKLGQGSSMGSQARKKVQQCGRTSSRYVSIYVSRRQNEIFREIA